MSRGCKSKCDEPKEIHLPKDWKKSDFFRKRYKKHYQKCISDCVSWIRKERIEAADAKKAAEIAAKKAAYEKNVRLASAARLRQEAKDLRKKVMDLVKKAQKDAKNDNYAKLDEAFYKQALES